MFSDDWDAVTPPITHIPEFRKHNCADHAMMTVRSGD